MFFRTAPIPVSELAGSAAFNFRLSTVSSVLPFRRPPGRGMSMRNRTLRTITGLASLSLAFAGGPQRGAAQNTQAEQLTVLRAGTLIDAVSSTPKSNQLIFVRGSKIEKVASADTSIPSGARVVDLSKATVLPGLIDSHTHIFLWGEKPEKGGYDANILNAGIALRA